MPIFEFGPRSYPVGSHANNPSVIMPQSSFPGSPPKTHHTQNPFSAGNSTYNNAETGDFSSAVLNYINDMLMDEELEQRPCMLQDSLALQAAEKSLYDVLIGQTDQYPLSSLGRNIESCGENFTPTGSSPAATANWMSIQGDHSLSLQENPFWVLDFHRKMQSFVLMSSPSEYSVQLGNEEETRNMYSMAFQSEQLKQVDDAEEGMRNMYSMAFQSEQLEQLDDAFLQSVSKGGNISCPLFDEIESKALKKFQSQVTNVSSRKRTCHDRDTIDLWTLLVQCAQAVGIGDRVTANEQLRLIRGHSSPYGNSNQRLAHYFAHGLEARMAGTQMFFCRPTVGNAASTAEMVRAYKLYATICPFIKMTNSLSNRTIIKVVKDAPRVHIIDFGIAYGFQWPCFLSQVATRPGGPPRVRITGIDFPQPGFQPAGRVEETGNRLRKMAERLNVPFEYHSIAQKWETIRLQDIKIDRDEVVVVNCMYRLENLLDDTTVLPNSPRDAVLELIRRINPDIFLHGVINGSYNAPFFTQRFREAYFHFSALFDMFEATVPREDQDRLLFEREVMARDGMNVIACEGKARLERPETIKQWQFRNSRMGFRQLPLHRDLLRRLRNLKGDYHKNFVVDEDGDWVVLGWKGRILRAVSTWKPFKK